MFNVVTDEGTKDGEIENRIAGHRTNMKGPGSSHLTSKRTIYLLYETGWQRTSKWRKLPRMLPGVGHDLMAQGGTVIPVHSMCI